jgi:hypothetical protein
MKDTEKAVMASGAASCSESTARREPTARSGEIGYDRPVSAEKSVNEAWERAAQKHGVEYANDIFPDGKPRSLSVELWRYIMWLQGSDPALLTYTEREHLAFWESQLGI